MSGPPAAAVTLPASHLRPPFQGKRAGRGAEATLTACTEGQASGNSWRHFSKEMWAAAGEWGWGGAPQCSLLAPALLDWTRGKFSLGRFLCFLNHVIVLPFK